MAAFAFNSESTSSRSDFARFFDPFSRSLGEFDGVVLRDGSGSQGLVLDSVRGELVEAPLRLEKKGIVSEAKAMAALKNHSEAERRRRERINAHLTTLRGLVPCNEKMDKATLLAEVIKQVKELKKNALESTKDLLIPMDADEVTVEPYYDDDVETQNTAFSFKASLCCEYRPELLNDLREALDALQMKVLKAEISTLGGRSKTVFILSSTNEQVQIDDANRSIHRALSSVLDKVHASLEYSPRTTLSNKRRRISFFESLSSSSQIV